MKNASALFTTVAITGIVALSTLYSCNTRQGNTPAGTATAATSLPPTSNGAHIAFVNIDSLESNYDFLKNKKEELKKRQESMENEMQRSVQQMQSDADEVQKKLNANTLTESEYKAAQNRLGQMQHSLETKKQALTDQLLKEQEAFQKEIKNRLDSFLADYNKDKKFDYILSYGTGSPILYANNALNITPDVIKGMNERSKMMEDKSKNK